MDISESIRNHLSNLLPSSILKEVTCFCLYDDHPRDSKKLDLVVCTKRGEVMEFYQRELVSSFMLENTKDIINISVLRNENCELFYFIHSTSQIIILSVKEKMSVHILISYVERYEFVDNDFSGLPCLKVIRKEDAVPCIYDCNFKLLEPITAKKTQFETFPVMSQLARKLTEANYNINQNQVTLEEYIKIKQTAAFYLYERNSPNSDESFFKLDSTSISKTLRIQTRKPLVKVCNNKVIVIVNVKNENNLPIENIHILFHGIDNKTITYTTKVYEQKSAIWKEKSNTVIENEECTVVAVIDMKEFKYIMSSRIEFEAALSFQKLGRGHMLPLQNVSISVMETMGNNFDLLMSNEDTHLKILGIMATSERTDLILRHIKDTTDPDIDILEVLCKNLNMESLDNVYNVLVKMSPGHILHGLTLILVEDEMGIYKMEVYSRSAAQVLALIVYIYDKVPHRILATMPDHILSAKSSEFARFNSKAKVLKVDFEKYTTSLLNISKQILEYFDECMIKMNESNEPEIKNLIGEKIHLLSVGLPEYLKFRNKILDELSHGVDTLNIKMEETCSEDMSIDDSLNV